MGFNSSFIKLQQHYNKETGFKYSQKTDMYIMMRQTVYI